MSAMNIKRRWIFPMHRGFGVSFPWPLKGHIILSIYGVSVYLAYKWIPSVSLGYQNVDKWFAYKRISNTHIQLWIPGLYICMRYPGSFKWEKP